MCVLAHQLFWHGAPTTPEVDDFPSVPGWRSPLCDATAYQQTTVPAIRHGRHPWISASALQTCQLCPLRVEGRHCRRSQCCTRASERSRSAAALPEQRSRGGSDVGCNVLFGGSSFELPCMGC